MASVSSILHSQAANAADPSAAAATSAVASSTALGNETTFLQLLVAQIKNQDPTQPMDSTTFVTQLAQFSQLEQLIGIRQDVQQLDTPGSTSTTGSATGSGTGSTKSASGN